MRSFIAALRTLILPFGPIANARIILDGVNGRISVFDNAGHLLMTFDSTGVKVFDLAGNVRERIGIPGAFSSISLFTADSHEIGAGIVSASTTGGPIDGARILFQSPDMGSGFLQQNIISPIGVTNSPMWQFITGFLSAALLQPIIDLCGDSAAGKIARVVLDDLWFGSSLGAGNPPNQTRRIGQGLVPGTSSGNLVGTINSSTTVGTVVDIVALLNVPVRAGFKYRLVFRGYTFSSANSLAPTNQWEIGIDVDDGSGRVDVGGWKFNNNTAGDIREGVPTIEGEFTAAADGTIDVRATVTKVVGANISSIGLVGDATHPMTLRCYHVG
jgi:hypothetical protein